MPCTSEKMGMLKVPKVRKITKTRREPSREDLERDINMMYSADVINILNTNLKPTPTKTR